MTRASINDEQTPSAPLCACQSAETPGVGSSRGEGGLSGPQTGTQGVAPHAQILEAVARAVREGRYWLPADGQRAIADAVVAAQQQRVRAETEDRPRPGTFIDGCVDDLHELYAIHHAITDSGGQLTPSVHRALDALRDRWDLALRNEQQRNSRPTA